MSTNRLSTSGQRPGFEPLEARCLLSGIAPPPLVVPVHPPDVGVIVRVLPEPHDPNSPVVNLSPDSQTGMGWKGPQSDVGPTMRPEMHPALISVIPPVDSTPTIQATDATGSADPGTAAPWLDPQTDPGALQGSEMRPAMHAEMIVVTLPWDSTWPTQATDATGSADPGTAAPWLGPQAVTGESLGSQMRPAMHADMVSLFLSSDSPSMSQATDTSWAAVPGMGAPPDPGRFNHPNVVIAPDHLGLPVPSVTVPDPSSLSAPRVHLRVDMTTDAVVDAAPVAQAATSPIGQAPAVPATPSTASDESALGRPQSATAASLATVSSHSVPDGPTEKGPAPTVTPSYEKGATGDAPGPGTATPATAATAEEEALEDLKTPTPQSAGLIAEVATLDGAAIEATVARLLDRFRDLATPLESPAPGVPSPLMVAAAVASIEFSRRWVARRRRGGITITVCREDRLALHGFS